MEFLLPVLFLVVCYFCGSIPFGLLIGFLAGKDVRKEGSGNIGFTNVLRVCGKAWGIPVLVVDMLKGFAPVFFLSALFFASDWAYAGLFSALGGICTVLGHNYTCWLKFKGGKGVATGAGALAALVPLPFVCGLTVFLLLVAVTRYISVGSMASAFTVFVIQVALKWQAILDLDRQVLPVTVMCFLIWSLVMVSHRSNIKRLLNGTENKIGQKKTAAVEG